MDSLLPRLLALLEASPDGLTRGQLEAAMPEVARRTLQRALADAVISGALRAEGRARATRYVTAAPVREPLRTEPDNLGGVPVSPDSRDVLEYVSRPETRRHPVGYQREFLDDYQPNVTHYLSEPLRRRLRQMGQTGDMQRPAGTYGRAVLDRLLIDLSWASSHLEGNTYSRLDTAELIQHGQAASGKQASEAQMILNHKAAIELLIESAEEIGFDRFSMLNLHSLLSENLLPEPLHEGALRKHAVLISRSVYRPLEGPQRIEESFELLLAKARVIADPFEQAFFAMVHIPYLQPFADVNKRVSRLAANIPLIRHNFCPLTFVGVPEDAYVRAVLGVYEMTRVELLRDVFLWAYERSTTEYLALKREVAQPDALRLRHRQWLRDVVRHVVLHPELDAVELIHEAARQSIDEADRESVVSLAMDEVRRLHEGVLMRYGLRPSEFTRWIEKVSSS